MSVHRLWVLVGVGLFVWVFVHVPGILYGTHELPLHSTYIGDEQGPVYGALHILEERSITGLRNESAVYYGPVLSLIVLPAVIIDAGVRLLSGDISTLTAYKDYVVWDWGGVIEAARLIAVLAGFAGCIGIFLLFTTHTLNPSRFTWLPYIACILLATNFLYFSYASFFKHWIFVCVIIVWQMYILIRILEVESNRRTLWMAHLILSAGAFGISYLPVLFLTMWTPLVFYWLVRKDWDRLREWAVYVFGLGVLFVGIVYWHPYAFFRILGMVGIIPTQDTLGAVLDVTSTGATNSFGAYAVLLVGTNFFLLLALFALVSLLFSFKYALHKDIMVWSLGMPALLNYVLFSLPEQHVTRYMLPTVVLLVVLTLYLLAQYLYLRNISLWHWSACTVCVLLAASSITGLFHIVGWSRVMLAGPPEQELIREVLELQKREPNSRILLVDGSLLGHAHTTQAYERYLTPEERTFSLWQKLLHTLPPPGTEALGISYERHPEAGGSYEHFDHVILKRAGYVNDGTIDTHLDVYDTYPWAPWQFAQYRSSFIWVK